MPVYVQHEALGKVNDVFNAEAIWQAPGLALFARRPLLRDLLERSPRELRGRAPTRCFSHITLLLAQDELDDDRHLTRGARVRDLAQSLRELHKKDFGDLLGNDEVRYDVVGTESLEPGQVEVKFGHAVYLPAAGETALYQIETSLDGASWHNVCPMYTGQRLLLIGQNADLASHAVPGWPFGGEGAILLVNDGPQAPIEVQIRPKGALVCTLDNDVYTIDANGTRLYMKVTRSTAAKPAAVWKPRAERSIGETAVPFAADPTFAPLARQRASLVALALPRLSRYRETGSTLLEVGVDSAMRLVPEGGTATATYSVDTSDQLQVCDSAGKRTVLPDGATLLAAGGAMAERYCALLRLGGGIDTPLPAGARFVFGRSAPMLAALRVLDAPRFLQRTDGAPQASADRLGLSRNAFSFELVPGGCQIRRLSPTQALYHLDTELQCVAAIGDIAGDKPYLLPPGHHLAAGHYVLRFDA